MGGRTVDLGPPCVFRYVLMIEDYLPVKRACLRFVTSHGRAQGREGTLGVTGAAD